MKRHRQVAAMSYSNFKDAINDATSLTYVVLFFFLLPGSSLKYKREATSQ